MNNFTRNFEKIEVIWNCEEDEKKLDIITLCKSATIIDKSLIRDKNLSWAARGVAVDMCFKNANHISYQFSDYPSELVQELKDQGYLSKN